MAPLPLAISAAGGGMTEPPAEEPLPEELAPAVTPDPARAPAVDACGGRYEPPPSELPSEPLLEPPPFAGAPDSGLRLSAGAPFDSLPVPRCALSATSVHYPARRNVASMGSFQKAARVEREGLRPRSFLSHANTLLMKRGREHPVHVTGRARGERAEMSPPPPLRCAESQRRWHVARQNTYVAGRPSGPDLSWQCRKH